MTPDAPVAILLCTYNGADHLQEQLLSIEAQGYPDLRLVASDDGSGDSTLDQLKRFAAVSPVPTRLIRGPGRGHTANFLSLVCDASIEASYFAYADQDDCWDADKIGRAVARLAAVPAETPALYCGRTRAISESGEPLGLSPLFRREPSFRNALVQNIAGGNTMVFNLAARRLLAAAGIVDVVCHDWWTYLLVSGAGGTVIYDSEPSLSYRQHDRNEIGANLGAASRARRYARAFFGANRDWNDRNLLALQGARHLLAPGNSEVLDAFSRSREGGLFARFRGLRQTGLYAQTPAGNFGLYTATLLKKI